MVFSETTVHNLKSEDLWLDVSRLADRILPDGRNRATNRPRDFFQGITMTTSTMTITTNNIPRDVINGWELTTEERNEFDYLNWEAIENGEDSASFFRYRGELYDLNEFSRVIPPGSNRLHPMECDSPEFVGWMGYASDSFFSGLLVKYVDDGERVVVGRYSC